MQNTSSSLGPLQAEYKVHAAKNRANLLFGRLFVVAGPAILLFSGYRAFTGSGDGLNYICGGLGLLLLLGGVYALWEQGRDRSLRVGVHHDAFIYTRSGKTDVVRWDEIEEARMQILSIGTRGGQGKMDTVYAYEIRRQGGPELKFRFNKNSIRNIDALSAAIQQEVTRRHLPRAMQTLAQGKPVQFGKLSVDNQGIGNGKETVSWDDVEDVQVNNGAINIRKKGKWLNWSNVSVGETPNVFVFLALVDGVMKQRPDLSMRLNV